MKTKSTELYSLSARTRTLLLATLASLAITNLSASTVSCHVNTSASISDYATSTADINGVFAGTGARVAAGTGFSPNAFSCPAISAPAGSTIQNYQLLATGDYAGGPFGTTTGTVVDLTYQALSGAPAGVLGALRTVVVSGGNSSTATVPPTPFQIGSTVGGASAYGAFNVSLNSSVLSGAVGDSSAQVVISYTVSTATGEPMTAGMVMLGLGVLWGINQRRMRSRPHGGNCEHKRPHPIR